MTLPMKKFTFSKVKLPSQYAGIPSGRIHPSGISGPAGANVIHQSGVDQIGGGVDDDIV